MLLIKPLKKNKNKKINFKIKLHLIFSYVAIFAKYWFISTWFKWNLTLFVAFSASRIVHLSIASEIVSSATEASSRFIFPKTILASNWFTFCWFKWYFTLSTAISAFSFVHFSFRRIPHGFLCLLDILSN